MLELLGRSDKRVNHCDGLSRRGFLRVGGMAAGGLSLSQLLAVEAQAGVQKNHKAVINIYLPGGPSHIDLWDPKPDAPSEVRGEFSPIKTNVPGIEICELFPMMAKMMDKFAIIRSISDASGDHDCFQCMTGHKKSDRAPAGGWPAFGAWVSRVQGAVSDDCPPHLSIMYPTSHRSWGEPGAAGFVGNAHNPVQLFTKEIDKKPEGMKLEGISLERLHDRRRMLKSIDRFRRSADSTGAMEGLDLFSQQAMGILTTSKLADALDLSQEDPRIVERYGKNDPEYQRDGAPRMVHSFLTARRLVEAGARVVSLNYSRWDWHGGDGMNFPSSRIEFPMLDRALCALCSDLHERGLDKDVSVVVWGEFGRTPKINKSNSRDHWPQVSTALLFGGGMKTGQVIGKTNSLGEYAVDRPVKFQEVFATLYHNMGIDVRTATVQDHSGRPMYLVESGIEPMRELI